MANHVRTDNLDEPPEWARKSIHWVWRLRFSLLLLTALLTVIASCGLQNLTVDNSLSAWFVGDEELLQGYHQFLDDFVSDDLVIISLEGEQSFATVSGTQALRDAQRSIAGIPVVITTLSFLDIADVATRAPDFLVLETLEDLIAPPERLAFLHADPLIKGRLLSTDGKSAIIIARLQLTGIQNPESYNFADELTLALEGAGFEHSVAGTSVVYAELNRLSRTEGPMLLLLAIAIMTLLLMVLMRRIAPVLVALSAATLAIIWTLSLSSFSGGSINVLTSVVPVVILVISISNCVHIFIHQQACPSNGSGAERIRSVVAFMLWPCGLAAATTVAGFASLMVAELPMTAMLGQLLVAGIASVFMLVILLTLLLGGRERKHSSGAASVIMRRAARWLANLGTRRPIHVLLLFTLLASAAAFFACRVKIDAYPLELLPPDHPVSLDAARIEAVTGAYTSMEFVVSSASDVLQLSHLSAIDSWIEQVVSDSDVVWSMSLLDSIKRAHQLRSGGYPYIGFELPATAEGLDKIIELQDQVVGERLREWCKPPHHLRIVFAVKSQAASGLRRTLERIIEIAPEGNLKIEPVGLMPIWLGQISTLVSTQVKSFSVALVLVMGIIIVSLRRLDFSVLALAVNLFPVLATFGLMGLCNVRLDLGTVAVASVILGLVVDDTIHFLHRLRFELSKRQALPLAVSSAADSTGQAIVMSTLVISLGFAILGFSQTTSVAWFGLLIAMATLAALLADLLLAPAILVLMHPSQEKSPAKWQ